MGIRRASFQRPSYELNRVRTWRCAIREGIGDAFQTTQELLAPRKSGSDERFNPIGGRDTTRVVLEWFQRSRLSGERDKTKLGHLVDGVAGPLTGIARISEAAIGLLIKSRRWYVVNENPTEVEFLHGS